MLHCVVVGDPKPTVRWKNSTAIIKTGGRFEVFSNGSLKISSLEKSDNGRLFTCEAENSYGITLASSTLNVDGMCQNYSKVRFESPSRELAIIKESLPCLSLVTFKLCGASYLRQSCCQKYLDKGLSF